MIHSSPSADYSSKQPRPRKSVVPPMKVTKDMSVFEYLAKCTPPLERKIADIACSQTSVPSDLRDDAVQEVYFMWSNMKPDTRKYKPGQVASYAHQMARHAALRLRREIGSATSLPGSAFRKRKDGSSYVTPGVLAAPVDWNELESWYLADGADGPGRSLMQDADMASAAGLFEAVIDDAEASELALQNERVLLLQAVDGQLSERQRKIALLLVEGATFEEVQAAVNVKKGVLMRELAMVSTLLGETA